MRRRVGMLSGRLTVLSNQRLKVFDIDAPVLKSGDVVMNNNFAAVDRFTEHTRGSANVARLGRKLQEAMAQFRV